MKIKLPARITIDSLLYLIVGVCVYSFKISLGGVSSAAFRPDDILIILAFLILLVRGDIFRVRRSRILNIYAVFVGVSVFSSCWNAVAGRVSLLLSLLFDVRLVQYMVFYYLGYVLTRKYKRFQSMFILYMFLVTALILLQMFHIIGSANVFSLERASGNTNGPYEMAVVACFLIAYLGYQELRFLRASVACVILYLTASRISLIGFLASVCSAAFRAGRRSLPALIAASGLILLLLSGAVFIAVNGAALSDSNNETLSRIGSAASSSGLQTFLEDYQSARAVNTSDDYISGEFAHVCDYGSCEASQGDKSGNIRYVRWSVLLKSTLNSFDSIIIGLGPSFASTAVDGYFVRVFVETGLLGTAVFFYFLVAFWRRDQDRFWPLREYVLMVAVTAIYIDIFTSYKTMILLWLWHGINEARRDMAAENVEEGAAVHPLLHEAMA